MPIRRPSRFRWPWRSRGQIAREVDAELAFHLEMRAQELTAAGVPLDTAQRNARAEFGDIELTRSYCLTMDERTDRNVRLADHLAGWRQDVQYAARTLRRSPGFAIVSLLTLALAIGANTAIFSVARAVLLAPLPYGNPSSLVSLDESQAANPGDHFPLSPANFFDLRAQQRAFAGVAAYVNDSYTWLPTHGDPEFLQAEAVTPNMFDVLGVKALHGHTFVDGDDAPARSHKVVLSYRFWQRALAANPAAVGSTMTLGGVPYDIVGVMPRDFTLGYNESLWVPLDLSDAVADLVRARKQHYMHAIARIRLGVTPDAAQADASTIARRLEMQYPESNTGHGAIVRPLHDMMTHRLRPALWLLQGAAAMVLLIACANLTNLTLSRAIGRRRETALRAALGSGRGRLVRQMLAESVLLSIIGGALGVGVAIVGTRTLLALNPDTLPSMFDASVDGRVLLFSLVLSIGTGMLFGLLPAVHAARGGLQSVLKEGARGTSGGRGGERVRRTLVVAQVGLAVMLLIGAGLLIRSFDELTRVRLGFEPDHVLTGAVRAAGERYDSAAAVNRFFDTMLDEVRQTPGIVAVGAVSYLPTQGAVGTSLRVVGDPADEANLPELRYLSVRGDYFEAMRIPLLSGRRYNAADGAEGPKVVLINRAAEKRFFPKGDALGRRIVIGPDAKGEPMTIVGVVGDIREEGVDTPAAPTMFADHRHESWERTLSLVIRTAGEPTTAVTALRQAVRHTDATLALRDVRPLDDVVGSSLSPRRFVLGLVSSFAAIALLLAAIGIYGVLSYTVANRTRELGVRLALGATTRGVLLLIVRQGLTWSLLGLGLGVAAAIAGGRLLEGMLYGVHATDAITYAAVAGGLLIVVVIACLIPARRATRVDPITSVRAD